MEVYNWYILGIVRRLYLITYGMGTFMKIPFTNPVHLIMGMMIWALWLVLIYAGLSLGCIAAPEPESLSPFSWLNIALLIFTVNVSAFLLWMALRCWRYEPPESNEKQSLFILRVSAGIYLASAIATLVAGLPILVLPPCL